MKQFKDLEFGDHPSGDGLMGRMNFDNGYGVSVVRFKLSDDPFVRMFAENSEYGSYTDNENEWEVAILKDNDLCYTTDITSDVLGHQSESDIDEIMTKLQNMEE